MIPCSAFRAAEVRPVFKPHMLLMRLISEVRGGGLGDGVSSLVKQRCTETPHLSNYVMREEGENEMLEKFVPTTNEIIVE